VAGVRAPVDEDIQSLRKHSYKLRHLEHCEVFLPPKRVAKTGPQIVGIHDYMHSGVEDDGVVRFSGRGSESKIPPDGKDAGVMIDLKEIDLFVLLAEHHNKRVNKFVDLGDVENVNDVRHGLACWRLVNRVTNELIFSKNRLSYSFDRHVRA